MSKVKLGFLFLTRDNLNQPKIWEKFFADADKSSYQIYCHPKNKNEVTDPILKDNIIKENIPTKWGDSGVVKAEIKLMEYAYNDGCDMYILLSESHVPFYSYDVIYQLLNRYPYNMIDFRVIINKLIKGEHWMIFNKEAVHYFINNNNIDNFKDINIINMDEFYFPTMLTNNNIPWLNVSTTYVKWKLGSHTEYTYYDFKQMLKNSHSYLSDLKKSGHTITNANKDNIKSSIEDGWDKLIYHKNHPVTYNKLKQKDINDIENSFQLFGRKFDVDSDISNYIDQIWKRDTYIYLELAILTELYYSSIDYLTFKNDNKDNSKYNKKYQSYYFYNLTDHFNINIANFNKKKGKSNTKKVNSNNKKYYYKSYDQNILQNSNEWKSDKKGNSNVKIIVDQANKLKRDISNRYLSLISKIDKPNKIILDKLKKKYGKNYKILQENYPARYMYLFSEK